MPVAVVRDNNIKSGLQQLFAGLGFTPGRRVFIKPNLCGREPILPGENTSVQVMDALIAVLQERSCAEIVICHGQLLGSFDHDVPFNEMLHVSGFKKYSHMAGVAMVNLDDLPSQTIIALNGEIALHLPLEYMHGFDTYINLAKIKTHMETTVSLSMKNQMGLAAQVDRIAMHRTDLDGMIAELAVHCRPHVSILEGYPAMEGLGPHHGKPRSLNLLAAGTDMLELDSLVCVLLGYDPRAIEHLSKAAALEIGRWCEDKDVQRFGNLGVSDFKKAASVFRYGTKILAYPTRSCSRCIHAVNTAGRAFKKQPLAYWRVLLKCMFSRRRINIVFGNASNLKFNAQESLVCVGRCTRKIALRHGVAYLDKCPPGVDETREFIVSGILSKKR